MCDEKAIFTLGIPNFVPSHGSTPATALSISANPTNFGRCFCESYMVNENTNYANFI